MPERSGSKMEMDLANRGEDLLSRGWGGDNDEDDDQRDLDRPSTKARMVQREGGGAVQDDGRSRRRSVVPEAPPSTGGDVTICTPFSFSPSTDDVVDALPDLFLAYLSLSDIDHVMTDA
jgi:hypothetical protein